MDRTACFEGIYYEMNEQSGRGTVNIQKQEKQILTAMKRNMGTTDKILRISGAALLIVLYITKILSGTPGIIALVLAAILIVTSFIGFCPLYLPFGINTRKKD